MDDTTTATWQTLEQAATHLNISLRTLHRWIEKGRVQSRMTDGRREVWVDDTGRHAADSVTDEPDRQLVLVGSHRQLAERIAMDAEARVQAVTVEMKRARRWAITAWATIAVTAIAGLVGVWWGTRTLTTEQMRSISLADKVSVMSASLETATTKVTQVADERDQQAIEAGIAAIRADQAEAAAGRLRGKVEDLQAMLAVLEAEKAAQVRQGPAGWGWWGTLFSQADPTPVAAVEGGLP